MYDNPTVNIQGQRNLKETDLTLVAGTKTWEHGLKSWRPVGLTQVGAVATSEGLSITNEPDESGWYHGDLVLDSSNGSSTTKVHVVIWGY